MRGANRHGKRTWEGGREYVDVGMEKTNGKRKKKKGSLLVLLVYIHGLVIVHGLHSRRYQILGVSVGAKKK